MLYLGKKNSKNPYILFSDLFSAWKLLFIFIFWCCGEAEVCALDEEQESSQPVWAGGQWWGGSVMLKAIISENSYRSSWTREKLFHKPLPLRLLLFSNLKIGGARSSGSSPLALGFAEGREGVGGLKKCALTLMSDTVFWHLSEPLWTHPFYQMMERW